MSSHALTALSWGDVVVGVGLVWVEVILLLVFVGVVTVAGHASLGVVVGVLPLLPIEICFGLIRVAYAATMAVPQLPRAVVENQLESNPVHRYWLA